MSRQFKRIIPGAPPAPLSVRQETAKVCPQCRNHGFAHVRDAASVFVPCPTCVRPLPDFDYEWGGR